MDSQDQLVSMSFLQIKQIILPSNLGDCSYLPDHEIHMHIFLLMFQLFFFLFLLPFTTVQ